MTRQISGTIDCGVDSPVKPSKASVHDVLVTRAGCTRQNVNPQSRQLLLSPALSIYHTLHQRDYHLNSLDFICSGLSFTARINSYNNALITQTTEAVETWSARHCSRNTIGNYPMSAILLNHVEIKRETSCLLHTQILV